MVSLPKIKIAASFALSTPALLLERVQKGSLWQNSTHWSLDIHMGIRRGPRVDPGVMRDDHFSLPTASWQWHLVFNTRSSEPPNSSALLKREVQLPLQLPSSATCSSCPLHSSSGACNREQRAAEGSGARFLLACHMELLRPLSCSWDHALQKVQSCWRHPNQTPRPRASLELQALLIALPGALPCTPVHETSPEPPSLLPSSPASCRLVI